MTWFHNSLEEAKNTNPESEQIFEISRSDTPTLQMFSSRTQALFVFGTASGRKKTHVTFPACVSERSPATAHRSETQNI